MLLIVWSVRTFCHIGLQAATTEISSLLDDLPKLLDDVRLAIGARMRYMRDGAPAHSTRAAKGVLNNSYHD
jgi:hypothetical protein